ncbi:MAG: nuclear transport factor 2 family protein [Pseudohongiellaceae bacterium]
MDRTLILDIEQACTRLINQFAVFNDAGRFHELVDLFTPDGLYARPIAPDTFIVGRTDILASFEARPRDRVGRHLITNVIIDVQDSEHASGFCYVTLYSGSMAHKAEKFGLQAQASQFIGEYADRFVLTAQGWKFTERKGCIIFTT